MATIKGITIEIAGTTSKLVDALKSADSAIKGTQREVKALDKLLKLDPSNVELLSQKQDTLTTAVSKTKEKLDTLKEASRQAEQQHNAGTLGKDRYDALQQEIIRTQQELGKLVTATVNANTTLSTIGRVGDTLRSAGRALTSTGKSLTVGLTLPIAGVATAAVKTGMDFDAAMSKVQAISGASGEDFDKLRDKAREMGAQTKFSASEAADAFGYMAMAGWKTEQMMDGIEGVMNLAASSGESLASTSDIVTDAMSAFGYKAKDAGHFADVLAATAANSNTNVGMLGESFKYIATTAGSYKASVEDTALALGLMANMGVKGTQAGTSLKNALVNLTKPTKQQAAAMQQLGLITTEYQNVVDPAKVAKAQDKVAEASRRLREAGERYRAVLNKSAADSPKAVAAHQAVERAQRNLAKAESELVTARQGTQKAIAGQNKLLTDESGNVRDLDSMMRLLRATLGGTNVELVDSAGGLRDFDDILKDATEHGANLTQVQRLQAAATIFGKQNMAGMLAIVNASQEDYDKLSNSVRNSTYNFQNMGDALKNVEGVDWESVFNASSLNNVLDTQYADFAKTVTRMVDEAGRTPEGLQAAAQNIMSAYGNLSKEEATRIVETVASLMEQSKGTAETTAATMIGNLKGQLTILKSALQELAIQISDALKPALSGIVSGMQSFVEKLQHMNESTRDSILRWGLFIAAIGPVLTIVGKMTSGFGLLFKATEGIGKGVLTLWKQYELGIGLGSKLGTMFSALASGPVAAIVLAVAALAAGFVYLLTTNEDFRNKCLAIWETVKGAFQTLWSAIATLLEKLAPLFNVTVAVIKATWEQFCATLAPVIEGAFKVIAGVLETVTGVLAGILKVFAGLFTGDWNTFCDGIKTIFSSVWNGLVGMLSGVFTALKGVASVFLDWFVAVWKVAWQGVKAVFETIWSSISDYISGVWDNIKTAVSSKAQGIWDSVKSVFTGMWDWLCGIVDKIKGIFNFEWSLPHIKLPHFKIKGEFSLSPPSVPYLSIDWYKKAMNDAYILNSPTIFGAAGGRLLGGGEAGSEAVVGTEKLAEIVRGAAGGTTIIPVYIGQERIEEIVVRANQSVNYRSGGR